MLGLETSGVIFWLVGFATMAAWASTWAAAATAAHTVASDYATYGYATAGDIGGFYDLTGLGFDALGEVVGICPPRPFEIIPQKLTHFKSMYSTTSILVGDWMLLVRESEPLGCKIEHPSTLFEFHLTMLYSVLFVITFIVYTQHLHYHRKSGARATSLHAL